MAPLPSVVVNESVSFGPNGFASENIKLKVTSLNDAAAVVAVKSIFALSPIFSTTACAGAANCKPSALLRSKLHFGSFRNFLSKAMRRPEKPPAGGARNGELSSGFPYRLPDREGLVSGCNPHYYPANSLSATKATSS